MMMMIMITCCVVRLTDDPQGIFAAGGAYVPPKKALFPAGTIIRHLRHHESPAPRAGFELVVLVVHK